MKKYQNISNELVCVVFKTHSQFLYRGQSVESEVDVIKVPKGVSVTETGNPVVKKTVVDKPKETVKKASSSRKKKVNSGE